MEVKKEELRRLAGHASTGGWDRKRVFGQLNIQDDNHMLGDNDAAFIAAANPSAILSLLDENERLASIVIRTGVRNFSLNIKDRMDERKLDECLSEGISMLEDENAQMRAENERLRKDAERWNWYAPQVACRVGDTLEEMNGHIDAAMAKEGNSNP